MGESAVARIGRNARDLLNLDRAAFGRRLQRLYALGVRAGLPPERVGYRWVESESLAGYFARGFLPRERLETVHPRIRADNPLPLNVSSRSLLPADRGWWGFSFHDVPARMSGETQLATCADCRVLAYRDPRDGDLFPTLVNRHLHAFALREMAYRPAHGPLLQHPNSFRRRRRATWILERSYGNYAHWLTAHIPKLLLLRDRGLLEDVLLPSVRTPLIDRSLRCAGFEPGDFLTCDPTRPLAVDDLTFLSTDRFRPELLQSVRDALVPSPALRPHRRIYVTREGATRRRLRNEADIWPLLERAGFERVATERLCFSAQVELMAETAWLVAPHGAGLTNMMFCAPGTNVVEIADLTFPNPNFYAIASAMGHRYWLVGGRGVGRGHPLDRDMTVDPDAVADVLRAVDG